MEDLLVSLHTAVWDYLEYWSGDDLDTERMVEEAMDYIVALAEGREQVFR